MEAELKEKLTKMAEATLRHLKGSGVEVSLEVFARKTRNSSAKNARLLAPHNLQRKLRDRRLWIRAQKEICDEWMAGLFVEILRKQGCAAARAELSAARARQLELFPGFRTLPTRIRSGSTFIKLHELSVPQFISYAVRYQKRAQRDQQTAEELRRLANAIEPFATSDLTVAAAFSRTQMEPAGLVLVKPKTA